MAGHYTEVILVTAVGTACWLRTWAVGVPNVSTDSGHSRRNPKNTNSSDNPVHSQAFGNPLGTNMCGFQEVLDLLCGSPLERGDSL